MGDLIYKFRPLANEKDWKYLKQTISDRVLYMGQAGKLNDALEGRVELKGKEDAVQEAYKIVDSMRNDACVLSFSQVLEEPLMWAHYARGFQGLALVFDTSFCDWMSELYPVEYLESVPVIDIGDGSDKTYLREETLIDAVLLTKSAGWSYEKELRYGQFLSDRKGPGDYILAKFPSNALRSIVVGCRVNFYDRERVEDLVKKELPHVSFRFAMPDGPSTFCVRIQQSLPIPTAQEIFERNIRTYQALGGNSVMLEPEWAPNEKEWRRD